MSRPGRSAPLATAPHRYPFMPRLGFAWVVVMEDGPQNIAYDQSNSRLRTAAMILSIICETRRPWPENAAYNPVSRSRLRPGSPPRQPQGLLVPPSDYLASPCLKS